jgi:hypothetical protein
MMYQGKQESAPRCRTRRGTRGEADSRSLPPAADGCRRGAGRRAGGGPPHRRRDPRGPRRRADAHRRCRRAGRPASPLLPASRAGDPGPGRGLRAAAQGADTKQREPAGAARARAGLDPACARPARGAGAYGAVCVGPDGGDRHARRLGRLRQSPGAVRRARTEAAAETRPPGLACRTAAAQRGMCWSRRCRGGTTRRRAPP